jgi:hypothetical protein
MTMMLPISSIGVEFNITTKRLPSALNHTTAEIRTWARIPKTKICHCDYLSVSGLESLSKRPGEPKTLPVEF